MIAVISKTSKQDLSRSASASVRPQPFRLLFGRKTEGDASERASNNRIREHLRQANLGKILAGVDFLRMWPWMVPLLAIRSYSDSIQELIIGIIKGMVRDSTRSFWEMTSFFMESINEEQTIYFKCPPRAPAPPFSVRYRNGDDEIFLTVCLRQWFCGCIHNKGLTIKTQCNLVIPKKRAQRNNTICKTIFKCSINRLFHGLVLTYLLRFISMPNGLTHHVASVFPLSTPVPNKWHSRTCRSLVIPRATS